MLNYKNKYLKYKTKYLENKNLIGGNQEVKLFDIETNESIVSIETNETDNEQTIINKFKEKIDNGLNKYFLFYSIKKINDYYFITDLFENILCSKYKLIIKKENKITNIDKLKELFKDIDSKREELSDDFDNFNKLFEFIRLLDEPHIYIYKSGLDPLLELFDINTKELYLYREQTDTLQEILNLLLPLYNFIKNYENHIQTIYNYKTDKFITISTIKLLYLIKYNKNDDILFVGYMIRPTGRIGNMLFSIIHNLIYIIENITYYEYKYIFLYFDTEIVCLYTNGSNKQLLEYLTLVNCDLLLNNLIIHNDKTLKPIYRDDFYPYYIIHSVLDIQICKKLNSYLANLYIDLRKKEEIEDDKEYITISLHYRLSDFCATGFSKCYNNKILTDEGSNFRILSFIYYRDCLEKIFIKETDKNFKIIIYYLSSPLDDLFIKFFIKYLKISFDDLKEKIKFITEIDYLDELTDKTKIFDLSIIYSASLSNYLILSNSTFGFWMFYFKLLKLDDLPKPVLISNVYFGNYFIYFTSHGKLLDILNIQYFLWLQPDFLIKVITTTDTVPDKKVNLSEYILKDIKLYKNKIQFEPSCIVDSAYFICFRNDIIRTTLILIYIYLYIDELDLVNIIKILYCLDYNSKYGSTIYQQFYFDIFRYYILDQKELIKERILLMFNKFDLDITSKNKNQEIFNILPFFTLVKTNIDISSIKEYIELCTYKNTDIDKFKNFIYLNNDYIFEIRIDKPTDEFKNFIKKFIKNNKFLEEFLHEIDIFKELLNNSLFLLISKFWYISNFQKLSELKNIFDSKDTTKYNKIHDDIIKLYISIYGENNQEFINNFNEIKKLLYTSDEEYEKLLDNILQKRYNTEEYSSFKEKISTTPTLQIMIFIEQQIS